ncbi:pectinesterase [Musa troglodytarum]|uniref:pectinesterase n=2 Tax=Musa troglodytarum TaxID=320322 RepID=A0A9E7KQ57_9LILI|nr:pectinesterase [Musa troglodytarum]
MWWLVLFLSVFSIALRAPVAIAAASIARTIVVDLKGGGDFKSIQQAIDSVPDNNNKWTKIHVAAGVYREKVNVKSTKSYILLEGDAAQTTSIEWGDYNGDSSGHDTETSATFTSYASNFVAKRITFKVSLIYSSQSLARNTYNGFANLTPAVAAWILGDKSAFYDCSFIGFQDTLADMLGRHYFKGCYIEGVVDFIFGYGQSIYERCKISTVKSLQKPGYVTAQGRNSASDNGGFVFKSCTISGPQATYLGRAWRHSSRVIFYQTFMSDIIVPAGWRIWNAQGYEGLVTFAESGCAGPGSDLSGRVKWEKQLRNDELKTFIDISYIDGEGWLDAQPPLD